MQVQSVCETTRDIFLIFPPRKTRDSPVCLMWEEAHALPTAVRRGVWRSIKPVALFRKTVDWARLKLDGNLHVLETPAGAVAVGAACLAAIPQGAQVT